MSKKAKPACPTCKSTDVQVYQAVHNVPHYQCKACGWKGRLRK